MLKVKDKSLWGPDGPKFHGIASPDFGYTVGMTSMVITLLALIFSFLLNERAGGRHVGGSHAAAEFLVRLDAHKRHCLRSFDSMKILASSAATSDNSYEESFRAAIARERDGLRRGFPEDRLKMLAKQFSGTNSSLSRKVAQKIDLIRVLEISALTTLDSDAEEIFLQAARSPNPSKEGVARQLLAAIDHQQLYYSKTVDYEVEDLGNELMPMIEKAN
jgi:hypothetical protein